VGFVINLSSIPCCWVVSRPNERRVHILCQTALQATSKQIILAHFSNPPRNEFPYCGRRVGEEGLEFEDKKYPLLLVMVEVLWLGFISVVIVDCEIVGRQKAVGTGYVSSHKIG
jgi:hypothetical protein